jgi:hypothetical protein
LGLKKELIYDLAYYSADKAGNYELSNRKTIKIDKTSPEITIKVSPTPNDEGWNNSNVELGFTATDILSGIDIVTPDQVVSTEGSDQTFYGEAMDVAGNKVTTSTILNIDKTSPQTKVKVEGAKGENDWFVGNTTVTLTAEDQLSGLSVTEYSFDHGTTWKKYENPLKLTEEKIHTLYYRGRDVAGNVEENKERIIRIDQSSPVSNLIIDGEEGTNGWYISPVTVKVEAKDSLSQVAKTYFQVNDGELQEGNYFSIKEEGKYSIRYYSVDRAGNTEVNKEQVINIDLTRPEISVEVLPQPNEAGWNKTDVELNFTASDALSGIQSVTPDRIITTEGENQTYTGEVVDVAGNRNTTSITLNIDKTNPETSTEITGQQGESNWYVDEVTVTLMATDNISGVSLTEYSLDGGTTWKEYVEPIVLTDDHIYTLLYRSVDIAGNVEQTKEQTIKLDQTKPELIYTQLESEYYWNETLIVHFSAKDNLSGVQLIKAELSGEPIESDRPIRLLQPGKNTVIILAKDKAGNEVVVTQTFDLLIKATIDVKPNVIVLPKGKAKEKEESSTNSNAVMTVFIELPKEFDVSLIDPKSITLNQVIKAQIEPFTVNKAKNRLQVKFSRAEVQEILEQGENVQIRIDGNYNTEEIHIRGFETIRVK